MQSVIYKRTIRSIIRNVMRKKFPGLKDKQLADALTEISIAIHARFYGAAVDGVASPIWRDDRKYQELFSDGQPTLTAQEILDEGAACEQG
jgi:hypothetical protein